VSTAEEKAARAAEKRAAIDARKAVREKERAEKKAVREVKRAAIEARREAARQKRAAAARAKAEKRRGRQLYKGRWLTRAEVIAEVADGWQRTDPCGTIEFKPVRSSRGLEMVSMRLGSTSAEFFVDMSMAYDARDLIDQVMRIRSGAMAKKLGAKAKRAEKKAAEKARRAAAIGPPDAPSEQEQSQGADCFG
jgi:hypothetical protein